MIDTVTARRAGAAGQQQDGDAELHRSRGPEWPCRGAQPQAVGKGRGHQEDDDAADRHGRHELDIAEAAQRQGLAGEGQGDEQRNEIARDIAGDQAAMDDDADAEKGSKRCCR